MNRFFLVRVAAVIIGVAATIAITGQTVTTFSFSGSPASFTVPLCVNSITFDVRGAQAGTSYSPVSSGGKGGRVTGVLTVTPGQVLEIRVGGAGGNAMTFTGGVGGYNGGGIGGGYDIDHAGGGGGGASDIRITPNGLADRIVVSGGGGGGSHNSPATNDDRGGGGGGLVGESGYVNNSTGPTIALKGDGGTQTSGGNGGNGAPFLCTSPSGSLSAGGSATTCLNAGGGGGGGYYGGGAGVFGGGGGGSSYTGGSATLGSHYQGFQTGNGEVTLTYKAGANITISPSQTLICAGSQVTLTASGVATYSWSTGSGSAGIVVSPSTSTTYTVSDANPSGCPSMATVSIQVDPVLSLTLTNSSAGSNFGVCPSGTVMLTASGASTYSWNGGFPVSNGVTFSPTVASGYTVTSSNACGSSSAATSVSIHPVPSVSVTTSQATLCTGSQATLTSSGANTYSWSTGSASASIVVSPTVNTSYTISGINSSGCISIKTMSIQVDPVLSLTLTNSSSGNNFGVCPSGTVMLTASGASTYSWNGSFPVSNGVPFSPTLTSGYTVTSSNACGSSSAATSVSIHPLPSVSVSASQATVCSGNKVTLTANGASSYTWSPLSLNITNGVAFNPSNSGTYTVTATNSLGCGRSATLAVVVSACTDLGENSLAPADFLTYPNPTRGNFTVESTHTTELVIVSELGQVVRRLKLNESNDYKAEVSGLEQGIYFVISDTPSQTKCYKILVEK